MAIIRSMGVGSAKKSMGNVTYRTVRGRTVGSQKVASRPLTRATSSAGTAHLTALGSTVCKTAFSEIFMLLSFIDPGHASP